MKKLATSAHKASPQLSTVQSSILRFYSSKTAHPTHYNSINPATGKLTKQYECLTDKQLEEAIQGSWKSFEAWNPQLFGNNGRFISR